MSIGPLQALVDRLRQAGPGGASGLSDGELLARWARDRDEAAFELIVWRHGRLVLSVCRRLLRHGPDVEDAFQATFLVLVRKARSIGRGQALASWLHTVATRVALAARRRAARDAASGDVEALAAPAGTGPPDAGLRAVIDEEVSRLSEKYRIVFVLCCLEGKTDEAAARELGCPLGTVLSRLSRARRRLRERLARRGVTPAAVPALAECAHLPSTLAETTVQAATSLAAGNPAAPAAAALMEGAVHAMFMTKLKAATVAVMAFALMGVGGMAGYGGLGAQQPGTGRTTTAPGGDSASGGKDLKEQLDEAKANVSRLERALKDRDEKKAPLGRTSPYGTIGGGTTSTTSAMDLGLLKLKEDAASAEHKSAVASLDEARRRFANAEKAMGSPDDLDILKVQVEKARAEVDVKQAQLRLATLARQRAAKDTPLTKTKSSVGDGSPFYGKGAPSLESRVKALEDEVRSLKKELGALRGKGAPGTGAAPSAGRP